MENTFNKYEKGDVLICWQKGPAYGDKFTVIQDPADELFPMFFVLLCHKYGSICIVNNRQDYELTE